MVSRNQIRRYRLKLATALRYHPPEDNAPRVLVSGKGRLAERIENLATSHGIPVHQDPELAISLAGLSPGKEIPPQLYQVVAEVLAFIWHLESRSLVQEQAAQKPMHPEMDPDIR